ncbi:MAG TPA: efflux RND transporter periplasmic adaptor subunit [Syntrophobacteraceae bacterium]|nr:efflux RND transporter periplasmic adaptor subunit [Syntrophobacteraceae bacterium]
MNRRVSVILLLAALFYLLVAGSGQFFPPLSALRPAEALAASDMPGMPGMETDHRPPAKPTAAPVESTSQEAPTVEISPEKQQMIGVKMVAVSRQTITRTIRTVGRVEYDEKKLVAITTKYEGWVEKLYTDYTGKFVRKGEPLAEIYSPELFATQQEFLNLLRWHKDPGPASSWNSMLAGDRDAIVEAARQRLRLWDITENQIKTIEGSGKPIRTLTLFSPISGYVIQKMVVQGMRIMPGEKLFDLADLSTIWVIADVYEYELPLIRLGQTTRVRLSYLPGKEFASKIDYIYPSLSGESRTARVRLVMPNPGGNLMPQMFTNIEITIDLGKRLAIPDAAVIDTGERKIVYVDKGEGNFEPREVVTGLRADKMVEVLQGLKEGDRVASTANFLIDSEAQLRGVAPLHQH